MPILPFLSHYHSCHETTIGRGGDIIPFAGYADLKDPRVTPQCFTATMQSIQLIESEQWAKLRLIVDAVVRGSGERYFLESPATNPLSSSSFTKRASINSFAFSDAALGLLDAISCKTV